MAVVLTTVVVAGWYTWDQLNVPEVTVSYLVPPAERLTADAPSESLYRVDPTRSTVSYEVEESVAGVSRTAEGSTSGIAGDVVINSEKPSASRFGEMVVNVEQLTSDQELRDRRIRHDFLQSTRYKTASFVADSVKGLPEEITDGVEYPIEVSGELTVKEATEKVTLTGTAELSGGELSVEFSTTVLMSTYDIGPIELIGFIRTGDEVVLTFDLVFVDPDAVEIPTVLSVSQEVTSTDDSGPAFSTEVMPVLAENCASCHGPGGVGSEIWSLETAGDAAEVADGLSLVTESEYMPPWPASGAGVPLQHVRSLTTQEITSITDWADKGGALDVEASTPIEAPQTNGTEIRSDIEARYPESYTGSLANPNDYRCFIVDLELTEPTWVSGYEFISDKDEILHHSLAFRSNSTESAKMAATDDASEGGGWDCAEGFSMENQFLAWAPGQDPTRFPDGSAMLFQPGDHVVLQVHYHYVHTVPSDRSGIRLEVSDFESPKEVQYTTYLAPAEIPCREGLESGGLCNRDDAFADLLDQRGIATAIISDGMLGMCNAEVADFAHMTTGIAHASCDHTIGEDSDAIAVFGHMHEIGDAFRMTLNPDTPEEQILLDIPTWSFAWQLNYEFAKPVELNAGDTLRVECTWDRAHLPVPENRYITWSERTEDEMCYSALTTVER